METNELMADKEFTPGWSAFTADWFSGRAAQWKKHILPEMKKLKRPVRWLEIGTYEGRSACWVLGHALTEPGDRMVCVDLWPTPQVKERCMRNLDLWLKEGRCTMVQGDSIEILKGLGGMFDVIYVDADHTAKAALLEGLLAWRILQPGGFLMFDDYPWKFEEGKGAGQLPPKPGIDAFLDVLQHELVVLHKEWQVIVRKN